MARRRNDPNAQQRAWDYVRNGKLRQAREQLGNLDEGHLSELVNDSSLFAEIIQDAWQEARAANR